MNLKNIFLMTLLLTIVSFSQEISLHGTVRDQDGNPVADAVVQLEGTETSVTTADDGIFNLSTTSGIITHPHKVKSGFEHIGLKNGYLIFRITREKSLETSIYNLSGRQISKVNAIYTPGTHRVSLPPKSSGMYIVKLCAGKETRIFTSTLSGSRILHSSTGTRLSGTRNYRADIETPQKYVISIIKEGYLNYRMEA